METVVVNGQSVSVPQSRIEAILMSGISMSGGDSGDTPLTPEEIDDMWGD